MAMKKRGSKTTSDNSGGFTLKDVIKEVESEYGESVIKMGDAIQNETYLPTDIFTLDMALLGGIPECRFTLVYGWESSGKSLLALKTAAAAQRKYPDKKVFYANIEGTYDPNWAEVHGVDNSRLIEFQPTTGEQAVDVCVTVPEAEDVSLIIVDSLAMLVPMKDIENSAEDATVATQARLITKLMVKLKRIINMEKAKGHKVTVLFINQFRIDVGKFFGDNRTLPGGKAQLFAADVRIEMKNKEIINKSTNVITVNEHNFVITKNKLGNSIRTAQFNMIRDPESDLGIGFIDDVDTVCTFAKKYGLIAGRKPNWVLEGVEEPFETQEKLKQFLYDNPDKFKELKKVLVSIQRKTMGLPVLPPDEYL